MNHKKQAEQFIKNHPQLQLDREYWVSEIEKLLDSRMEGELSLREILAGKIAQAKKDSGLTKKQIALGAKSSHASLINYQKGRKELQTDVYERLYNFIKENKNRTHNPDT